MISDENVEKSVRELPATVRRMLERDAIENECLIEDMYVDAIDTVLDEQDIDPEHATEEQVFEAQATAEERLYHEAEERGFETEEGDFEVDGQ